MEKFFATQFALRPVNLYQVSDQRALQYIRAHAFNERAGLPPQTTMRMVHDSRQRVLPKEAEHVRYLIHPRSPGEAARPVGEYSYFA